MTTTEGEDPPPENKNDEEAPEPAQPFEDKEVVTEEAGGQETTQVDDSAPAVTEENEEGAKPDDPPAIKVKEKEEEVEAAKETTETDGTEEDQVPVEPTATTAEPVEASAPEGTAAQPANSEEAHENVEKPEANGEEPPQESTEGPKDDVEGPQEKVAEPQEVVAAPTLPLPSGPPSDRDVDISKEGHRGTILLHDLARLHCLLLRKLENNFRDEEIINDVAGRLTTLMMHGRKFELSGLKDVPHPFLKGEGYFFNKDGDAWKVLSEDEARAYVVQTIMSILDMLDTVPTAELKAINSCIVTLYQKPRAEPDDKPPHHNTPKPCDILFLPRDYEQEENTPYENQTGNKHLLFLASQHVSAGTRVPLKRLEAAFRLVTSQVEVSSGTELLRQTPKYIVQYLVDNQNTWQEIDRTDLIEFAVVFVFEVFLEKQYTGPSEAVSKLDPDAASDIVKPSTVPVDAPTPHDVLFGRGGMTNGHPGNRRFRDIIALHRPDYISATKMDKPNVARRIVRAIRHGDPPGRFLKKSDDGKWYDVGDRCASEKTSQGLRERSNAEKRQRSALREALRIRREDLVEKESTNTKRRKKGETALDIAGANAVVQFVGTQMNYTGGIPLSLNMKPTKQTRATKRRKSAASVAPEPPEEAKSEPTESLPPNAVDKDGNILVTEYDILCGRGGLTNHHRGNKRFRDIVALHRPDYVRAPKIQKPSVARVIVRAIRNGDPPGRFLRKDEKSGKWIDIGDKRAAEKTSQALREKTNEEREKRASSGNFTSQTLVLLSPTGHKKGGRKKSAPKAENGAADAASSGPVAAADDEAKTSETEPAAEAKNEDETTPMEVEGEQGATAEV